MTSIADRSTTSTAVRPFRVEIPEEALEDLRRRLEATRWPERETVADASQGVQLATMEELARYWANEYDFGRLESRLNAFPHFGLNALITSWMGLAIAMLLLPAYRRPTGW